MQNVFQSFSQKDQKETQCTFNGLCGWVEAEDTHVEALGPEGSSSSLGLPGNNFVLLDHHGDSFVLLDHPEDKLVLHVLGCSFGSLGRPVNNPDFLDLEGSPELLGLLECTLETLDLPV